MTNAAQEMISHSVCSAALPKDGSAPEWIVIFPKLGKIKTRDGRSYDVDGAALLAAFKQDEIDVPIDVMHQSHSAAVGWICELKIEDGALKGRADWNEDGKALLAAKKYRYGSPSFYHDPNNRTTRLRAVALVTAPALGNQPALASAQQPHQPEPQKMKQVCAALGLSEDASETACLSALNARLADSVPKPAHEKAVAALAAATAELAAIKDAAQKAKVEALIEGSLTAKKILPGEKEQYIALCATEAGFETVAKLLAAKGSMLAGSGLDRKAPREDEALSPAMLAAKAGELVKTGAAVCLADAVTMLTEKGAAQ